MSAYFSQAGVFLVDTILSLYIFAVLLRFLFQLARADFYNPISQALVMITNPPLLPLRKLIPGFGGVDVASVVLLLALEAGKLYLVGALRGFVPAPLPVLVVALGELLQLTVYVYIFAIIVRAIASWIMPYGGNPFLDLLDDLTEPLLRPARRMLPPISGLDLSPLLVLILLQLTLMLIVQPLMDPAVNPLLR